MNKVRKAAKKIIHKTKTIDLNNIITYLQSIGYAVIFYNTPDGDKIVQAYDLQDKVNQTNSFICSGSINAVFVNDKLHNREKLYAILHETGHLLLNHIGEGCVEFKDKMLMESEAEAFVYVVLNYQNNIKPVILTILCAILSFIVGFAAGEVKYSTHDYSNDIVIEDIVYITPTGSKYHKDSCIYTKDKTLTGLPRSEADKNYQPCAVCNP